MKRAWLNQAATAKRLDLTSQALRKLHARGLPHERRGRSVVYPFPDSEEWYADFKGQEKEARGIAIQPADLKAAQARKAEVQAKLGEIELAKAMGELIPRAVHEAVVQELADRLASYLKNLPAAWSKQLTGHDSPREVAKVLRKIVGEAIEDLASVLDDRVDFDQDDAA